MPHARRFQLVHEYVIQRARKLPPPLHDFRIEELIPKLPERAALPRTRDLTRDRARERSEKALNLHSSTATNEEMQVISDVCRAQNANVEPPRQTLLKPSDRLRVAAREHRERTLRPSGAHRDVKRALRIDRTHQLSLALALSAAVLAAWLEAWEGELASAFGVEAWIQATT